MRAVSDIKQIFPTCVGISTKTVLVHSVCVAFIDSALPVRLRASLSEFRDAVDKEFPGRYGWLDETSLHCTLRSLG